MLDLKLKSDRQAHLQIAIKKDCSGKNSPFFCGERRIRTFEVVRQRIYSPSHLAALESPHAADFLSALAFRAKAVAKLLLFTKAASVFTSFFRYYLLNTSLSTACSSKLFFRLPQYVKLLHPLFHVLVPA